MYIYNAYAQGSPQKKNHLVVLSKISPRQLNPYTAA